MRRTTIFLDDKLLRQLKRLAQRRGVSFASVVREAMATYVAEPASAGAVPSVAGRFASDSADTSARVDDLLWKEPHE
jgi:predicted transcriptional regulator